MKDNSTDENEPGIINEKFWSYFKSANKSHRIPNSVNYKGCHRTEPSEQAELFNQFFMTNFPPKVLMIYRLTITNLIARLISNSKSVISAVYFER